MNFSVSVIIPFYKDIKNLENILCSLFADNNINFETIVVDDASNKDIDFVNKYPCKVIRLKENMGASYARNAGVKESKGDIILFTDEDCIVSKDWVENFSKELINSNNKNKNIAAVCGRIISKKDFFEMSHSYTGYAYVQAGTRKYMDYLNTSCVAVFREAFNKVCGFSEDMRTSEDCDFALKLRDAGYQIIFEPNISVFHDHGIDTFKAFLSKHKEWGIRQGLKLMNRHKNRYKFIIYLYKNVVMQFLFIVPAAFLTTVKIAAYNIKYDSNILKYMFIIFLGKINFRWGMFLGRNAK